MKFKENVKKVAFNKIEKYYMIRSKIVEKRKYQDARRLEIMRQRSLSNVERKSIDKYFLKYYGEKIPYIWHQHYTAFTGKFDVKYFPEYLFIPEFEHYMNFYIHYAETFSDKNVLPYIAEAINVKMPQTILSGVFGILRDSENRIVTSKSAEEIISGYRYLFAKPSVDSCSGEGCMALEIVDGKDVQTGKTINEILLCLGDSFVIQERIRCHESISQIYAESVNTFRIMTYRWKNEIKHLPIIMRLGKGGACVDNAHAGGIFIAIEDGGELHECAVTEFNKKYYEHPDSHLVFAKHKIPLVKDVISAAHKFHDAIPQLGVINWDFTIDQKGTPILIEANINGGSIWLFELAHGCGAFGEDTGEILQWLRKMKKLNREEQKRHLFGN